MSPSTLRQPGDVVNEIFSESIKSLIQMCVDVGDDPTSLIEQAKHELQKMVAEMMAEDDALLERKRAELAPIRARFEALWHELHPDKSCPQHSTLPVLIALRTYADEHKKLKEEHQQLLEREPDIRREERQLCNELNERSLQSENGTTGGTQQLVTQMSLLAKHITELREEKAKRIAHLTEIVRTLQEFEEVYGWKRLTSETMVGRLLAIGPAEIDQFTLTKEALELVDKEFAEITDQVHKAEVCFEQSHKQLTTLMRKHQSLMPNKIALTVSNINQVRLSKLPDLIAEVDRYTEHAMDKLTRDILKARERIHVILNKLSVGDVSNNSKYAILNTSDFTEDVYFMHEELAQELEAQYELNRSMYEQIEAWNELFVEFQEFEKNASDPQRFHRRGYSALAEEKTRKRLEVNLRESEMRLQSLAEDFLRKNHGQPFIMSANGQQIADYIVQRKQDYVKAKEREREAAKAAAATGTVVGRTPLRSKQWNGAPSSVISKRSDLSSASRTPLTSSTSRRLGVPMLPTGKTPLHSSTIKTRMQQKQLQTSKRNMDVTPSNTVTPVKQRRLVGQLLDTMKNTSSQSSALINHTTTENKSTVAVTPGKRPLLKRAIPTPIRTHNKR